MAVSVVIPVYNSQATLPELVARLAGTLEARALPFEVLLVNDGSRDGSWDRIVELARAYPEVRGIDLGRNYGQHNALLCGIRAARHPAIVTMDDDLQHPPEEVPRLLVALDDDGADVVYAPPVRERHDPARDLASILFKRLLAHVMGVESARSVSAFRAFRTRLRDSFANYHAPYVTIDVLLSWGTRRFAVLPVEHAPRAVGRSTYTFRKLVAHAANLLCGFSTLPLQLANLAGFVAMAFGLAVLALVVGRYLVAGSSVPGFPFLASVIAIFSGTQLFALGIIGTYLARIHLRTMDQPPYSVRTTTPACPAAADRDGVPAASAAS
jgi:undecaprenyl-phosphate 4-deoxy-4-formamido-L-arabinose transferase